MTHKFEYLNKVESMFEEIVKSQGDKMMEVANLFVDNIKADKLIHVFGTGHSQLTGIEVFARAGGLSNINLILDSTMVIEHGAQRAGRFEQTAGVADIIYDQYNISAGDIMIITSNSGRNALPIEMAIKARENKVFVIALTNVTQSKNTTSRHKGNKNLYELADLLIDTCVPSGDSLMEIAGAKTAPGSSMSTMLIMNIIVSEALKILAKDNKPLPIFQSQNVDGYDNDAIYKKYKNRIKHY